MRNIVTFSAFLVLLLHFTVSKAQDDVYDAPATRPEKTKTVKYKDRYKEQYNNPSSTGTTQPYSEGNSSTTRLNGSNNVQNNNYYSDNYDSYADDWNYGYTDRIRRFHNPSFQFNYGWNNWNNNYYSPWSTYNNSWNNWDNYAFTPSWTYGYSNFCNPFYGNYYNMMPGFGIGYSPNIYSPFNNWGYYNNWYGFSPYSAGTIYNYGYNNYGGYYDYNKKNVVYAPRTGGYTNTTNAGKNYYNNNYPSGNNTNNTNGYNKNNNSTPQQQVAPKTNKWENRINNNNYSNPNPENTYRYNNQQPSYNNNNSNFNNGGGGWNNSQRTEPNINSGNGNSGIRIGTRAK